MIINIRGTNGSGKSTIVRQLLQYRKRQIYGILGPRKCEANELVVPKTRAPLFILGSYDTPTGGCDSIQPYDLILTLIEKYAARGHVLFEGVLISSSYGRVGQLMERWGQEAVMAFLTTPLETCIKHVQTRRDARADGREYNTANTISKFKQISKSRVKIIEHGKLRVVDLEPNTALDQIVSLLRGAK